MLFGFLSKWFSKSSCIHPTQLKEQGICYPDFLEVLPEQLEYLLCQQEQ
jgi:hypothetical protein